jgi:hypothetical protein
MEQPEKENSSSARGTAENCPLLEGTDKPELPLLCCFYIRFGSCTPPRPPCRYRHEPDDGRSPCSFGATCRCAAHARRVLRATADVKAFWGEHNADGCIVGTRPADRDATLLRSQLEPWPTAALRHRLVECFGESYEELDPFGRAELMQRLLRHYESTGPRRLLRVDGTPLRPDLAGPLLGELQRWAGTHGTNNRPSVSASSYMIMQSVAEFASPDSVKAKRAASKIAQYRRLWDLATEAISDVDAAFALQFTALAVTYGFRGSPHIDKQNTGAFYGLALGDFPEGQGGICVEYSPFVVVEVNTKNRLGKVDGRFPHWVAPYDESTKRYSLIFYQTAGGFVKPTTAVFNLPAGLVNPGLGETNLR